MNLFLDENIVDQLLGKLITYDKCVYFLLEQDFSGYDDHFWVCVVGSWISTFQPQMLKSVNKRFTYTLWTTVTFHLVYPRKTWFYYFQEGTIIKSKKSFLPSWMGVNNANLHATLIGRQEIIERAKAAKK